MKYTFPVHSVVDVITNSSSVIYTEARSTSIQIMKQLINEILSIGESSKTADDLFEFSLQTLPAEGVSDWLRYGDFVDDEDAPQNIVEIHKKIKEFEGDYKATTAYTEELAQKHESELFEYFNTQSTDWNEYPSMLHNLVIKTKDGVNTKFADRVLAMFNTEASYDG